MTRPFLLAEFNGRRLMQREKAGAITRIAMNMRKTMFKNATNCTSERPSQTSLSRTRLYHAVQPGPADEAALVSIVGSAVHVFVAAYGRGS